jgi:predicted O-linked N-acetylglucosamine transferase (SPINDLY family)
MAHFQLARALEQVVDLHGAIRSLRRALELRPDWLQARSSLLLLLSYDETCGHAELFREHAAFGIGQSNKAAPLQEAPVSGAEIPQPLRIGFVSADFRSHSIARLLLPVLQNLDRSAFEIHAFSNNREDDELTGRFRALIPHWHGIRGMSDLAAAELIRASGIHVLVDLSGHTDGHRLGVFARRPAPVQVTWFGYLATTGLAQMDYKITDARVDPPGLTEPQYSEKLIRLPGSLWCYQPIGPTPDVAPPPALASGRVTFGSFNNPLKIGPGVAAAWSRILNMVGGSRLLLKGRYLRSAEAKRALESLFVRHGIQPARLDIRAQSSDYLAEYADVDVALDTFPYNGGITTCDALWMGVPVVTLAGNSHAGRVGVSLLTSVGMPGLIAAAQDEYVEAAVELAGDTARLAELRGALRSRMAASPLMDAATHTRELELALAAAYRSAADRIEAECAMPDRRAEPPTWGW